jgi:hypothetical protein
MQGEERMTTIIDSNATALSNISQASQYLAQAKNLEDILDVRDKATAIAAYARAKGADDAHSLALELKSRAERKAGQFTKEIPREKGKRMDLTSGQDGPKLSELKREFGDSTVKRWEKLASIPESKFEEYIQTSKVKTQSALLQVAKEIEIELEREHPTPISIPEKISVQIIKGNFFESDQKNSSIDAIITDPPYPASYLGLWKQLSQFANRILKPSGFLASYSGQLHIIEVLNALGTELEYFWMMSLIHDSNSNLIQARGVFNRWRPVLIFNKPPMKKMGFDDLIQGGGRDKDHHDWGQDVSEAVKLIEIFSKPGDTIFEPFTGGGTTIEACIQTRRNCIAYEIDPKEYSRLQKRFPDAQWQ